MKPFAVISDVHSNLEALQAVIADIHDRGISRILFLGDAVGYGPDPDECIKLLKKNCHSSIMGNHDRAVLQEGAEVHFNEHARNAIIWTREHVSKRSIEYLRSLVMIKHLKRDSVCLVHSTPRDPGAWNYLHTLGDLETNFHYFEGKICFVGHSHIPFVAERFPNGEIEILKEKVEMGPTEKYIVNAGSVGQPRDGDPRACYVMVNGGRIEIIRVEYDIEKTQQKMLKADLPYPLIERLSRGH